MKYDTMRYAIIDENNNVIEKECDVGDFSNQFSDEEIRKQIARFKLEDMLVSTVFIGFSGIEGLWFETMIFLEGTSLDLFQERHETCEEALLCHERCVLRVLFCREKRCLERKK